MKMLKTTLPALATLLMFFAVSVPGAQAAIEVNNTTYVDILSYVPCADNGNGEYEIVGPLHTLIAYTTTKRRTT